jgi:hypothetical protein
MKAHRSPKQEAQQKRRARGSDPDPENQKNSARLCNKVHTEESRPTRPNHEAKTEELDCKEIIWAVASFDGC